MCAQYGDALDNDGVDSCKGTVRSHVSSGDIIYKKIKFMYAGIETCFAPSTFPDVAPFLIYNLKLLQQRVGRKHYGQHYGQRRRLHHPGLSGWHSPPLRHRVWGNLLHQVQYTTWPVKHNINLVRFRVFKMV